MDPFCALQLENEPNVGIDGQSKRTVDFEYRLVTGKVRLAQVDVASRIVGIRRSRLSCEN